MTGPTRLVESTADLVPDGWRGYAKGINAVVGLLGTLLVAIQPMVAENADWALWVGVAVALCGAFGAYYAANAVKPVTVVDENPPAAA